MDNAFFFQTQQISDDRIIFDQLKQQNIFFSYFFVDQNYYLFIYAQQSIDINLLYQSVEIIQELDSKQRKIRSLRGFFLYALEIIENAQDYEILSTNLQPFFWKKVKNIIRQNTKGALLEFLFGGEVTRMGKGESNKSVNQVSSLAQQVERLQHKVLELEAKLMRVEQNFKYPLSKPSQSLESSKTIQQGDSTLKPRSSSYWQENDNKFSQQGERMEQHAIEPRNQISESLSDASRIPSDQSFQSHQYNLKSNLSFGNNEINLILKLLDRFLKTRRWRFSKKDFSSIKKAKSL